VRVCSFFFILDPSAGGDLAVAMMVVVHACAGDPRGWETLRSERHGGKESSDRRRLFPSSFRPHGWAVKHSARPGTLDRSE
jgi:hypothetical protein